MNPTVLLYNLPLGAQIQIEALCREIGANPVTVEKARQGLTLGALVGLLPEVIHREQVPGQMLVLAYFDQEMLDAFLQGLRRRQVPPIPRKAMLTLTNTAWTGPSSMRTCPRRWPKWQGPCKKTDPAQHSFYHGFSLLTMCSWDRRMQIDTGEKMAYDDTIL